MLLFCARTFGPIAIVGVATTFTMFGCGSNDAAGLGLDGTPPANDGGDGQGGDASGGGGAGQPCAGTTCAMPPAAACANAGTRRTYASSGTCQAGICSYAPTDIACPAPPNADGICTAGVCASDFTCHAGFLSLGAGCVFGTAHDTWTTVASMDPGRYAHGAAGAADGRVYVLGGVTQAQGGAINFAGNALGAYTPSTNTWVTLASAPVGVEAQSAVALDGLVYSVGGFPSRLLGYSPSTNIWTMLSNLPADRAMLGAVTGKDGRIHAIGGYDGATSSHSSTTLFAYTPKTDTWSTLASMTTPRYALGSAVTVDGRIYAIGGLNNGAALSTVEVYTPSTNSWANVASMSKPRSFFAAAAASDGRIYAIGGDDNNGSAVATVEAYTPSTDTWVTVASMPAARAQIAAAVGGDGRIYVTGGVLPGGAPLATTYAYTP